MFKEKGFVVICVLFGCLVSITVAGRRHFRNDYEFVEEVECWYKIHRNPEKWHEARLRCHLEGAVLASPLTKQYELAMSLKLEEKKVNVSIFTGIHATFSQGDYLSIEGVPLSKIPHRWAENEPDNYKNTESCLEMRPDGSLADVSCEKTASYMCYKTYKTGLLLTSCGTVDPDYEFDGRTGKCYKFHRTPKTWSRAYMTCSAEGGHLGIIDSYLKSIVFEELFARNKYTTVLGNTTIASVGYHNWGENLDWRSIHGEALLSSPYARFGKNDPKFIGVGKYCGAIYWSSQLNDQHCDRTNVFICEKWPNSLLWNDEED